MTAKARAKAKRATSDVDRYASLGKILRLVRVLELTQGMTTAEIIEGQGLTRKTFLRYRTAIQASGLPLVSEAKGREKVWRIHAPGPRSALRIHQAQAVALLVQRRGTTFLDGTGFDELLEDVYRQAEATLGAGDRARVRHLDRKIFDRNDDAVVHEGRADDASELISALLYDERLEVRYKGRAEPFTLDPYSLVIYRKGLYVIGWSHRHGEIRRFALDRFDAIDRRRGDRFDYPHDYEPARFLGGAFGIAGDAEASLVRVRLFGQRAIEAVTRRRLHPSQAWEGGKPASDGSRVLCLRVSHDDLDLARWIFGFGDEAEVLEPLELVRQIAARTRAMGERYAARPAGDGL